MIKFTIIVMLCLFIWWHPGNQKYYW